MGFSNPHSPLMLAGIYTKLPFRLKPIAHTAVGTFINKESLFEGPILVSEIYLSKMNGGLQNSILSLKIFLPKVIIIANTPPAAKESMISIMFLKKSSKGGIRIISRSTRPLTSQTRPHTYDNWVQRDVVYDTLRHTFDRKCYRGESYVNQLHSS